MRRPLTCVVFSFSLLFYFRHVPRETAEVLRHHCTRPTPRQAGRGTARGRQLHMVCGELDRALERGALPVSAGCANVCPRSAPHGESARVGPGVGGPVLEARPGDLWV